jgi:hypothetical protein
MLTVTGIVVVGVTVADVGFTEQEMDPVVVQLSATAPLKPFTEVSVTLPVAAVPLEVATSGVSATIEKSESGLLIFRL